VSIAVLVATYGDRSWHNLAKERAIPSAVSQAPELVVVHEDAGTLAGARNRAAAKAISPTLVFLDADDELAPGYIEAFRGALAALDSRGMVGGDLRRGQSLLVPRVQWIAADGSEKEPEFPNRQAGMEALNHCVIGTAVPRDLFLKVGGFRADLPIYEDWALFLACVRGGARLVDVSGAIYRAFERKDSRNKPGPDTYETYWQIRNEHEVLRTRKQP
jgi:glycosyltransferase involved in cell wall biosynthesis